ncbi:MAG: hydroxymethylbilane synthase [Acidimicrobiaceae bacterium]|nr:hydroxymethylbilane synthase [Acidimicrobiaceae bacterium]
MTRRALRVATRESKLARWQADHVGELLRAAHPRIDVEMVFVRTAGDQRTDVPLHAIGGQGVFVREVQHAVLDGRADLAVHSAKDLPSSPTAGLRIAAVPARADGRDALAGAHLDALSAGAVVATGSVRRRAQLAHLRPELTFVELRGNIDTRLAKVPPGGAIVVALAALHRLGYDDRADYAFAVDEMVPQVGQGALAVETTDDDVAALVAAIDHAPSHACIDAERAFLAELGGGCELPAGAYAEVVDGALFMRAFLADGERYWREDTSGPLDDHDWARQAARRAKAVVGSAE